MRSCWTASHSVTPSARPTNVGMVSKRYPSSAMAGPLEPRAGRERVRRETQADRAGGQRPVLVVHHAGRQSILARIVVLPEVLEHPSHLPARAAAEEIGQLLRT